MAAASDPPAGSGRGGPHGGRSGSSCTARHGASADAAAAICRQLGCPQATLQQTAGVLVFAALVAVAVAAPAYLPWLFVAFCSTVLPWRCVSFVRQSWGFYLIDFCYFVNLAVLAFLLAAPADPRAEALVAALADGPLAGALLAWQCPWVFSSAEHATSVLMHLLPGLAMYGFRYFTPTGLRGWRAAAASTAAAARGQAPTLGGVPPPASPHAAWLVGAPLAFYVAWQALYFAVVQLLCRRLILARGYETSYSCLARCVFSFFCATSDCRCCWPA